MIICVVAAAAAQQSFYSSVHHTTRRRRGVLCSSSRVFVVSLFFSPLARLLLLQSSKVFTALLLPHSPAGTQPTKPLQTTSIFYYSWLKYRTSGIVRSRRIWIEITIILVVAFDFFSKSKSNELSVVSSRRNQEKFLYDEPLRRDSLFVFVPFRPGGGR